jgi:hypothetical protein
MLAAAIVTVTFAVACAPPKPVHVNEYVVSTVRAPVLRLPLVGCAPEMLPPEAVHVLALLDCQLSVDAAPLGTEVGAAVKVTVGSGATVTVCVEGALLPPGPEQVSEKLVVAVKAPVTLVPLVARLPFHPPPAVHVLAFVALQFKVAVAPLATRVGVAVKLTVGGASVVTATEASAGALLPPGPSQVNE